MRLSHRTAHFVKYEREQLGLSYDEPKKNYCIEFLLKSINICIIINLKYLYIYLSIVIGGGGGGGETPYFLFFVIAYVQ